MGLLQQFLLEHELDRSSSAGDGVDLVPLPKRPGSFTGFDGDAYMPQGSKSKSAVFYTILFLLVILRNLVLLTGGLFVDGAGSLVKRIRDRNQEGNSDPLLRELYPRESLELSVSTSHSSLSYRFSCSYSWLCWCKPSSCLYALGR